MSVGAFHEQYILHLKGITMSSFVSIEDKFNQHILDADKPENSTVDIAWDRIPQHFVSPESWVKSTNIRCWYCSMKFKSQPWFIITGCNNTSTHKIYDIRGNFCSCGCLYGFVNLHYSKRNNFDIFQNVYKLYEIMHGKSISSIRAPMDKTVLKMYGGNMTLDEYKAHIKQVDDENVKQGRLLSSRRR